MQQFQTLRGKALAFLLFATFLWFMSAITRMILAPLLPLLEDEFSVNHATASSLNVSSAIGYAASVSVSGVFARLLGSKKSIIASTTLAAVACFIASRLHTFLFLHLATFLIGVAGGMYLPAVIPLLTSYYGRKNWGKVIAIHDSGAGMSTFAAPLIATALLVFLDWRGVFFATAVTLVLGAIAFALVVEEREGAVGELQYLGGDLWRRRELWLLGTVGVFITGASVGFYFLIPLYLVKELGMGPAQANSILATSRIGGIMVGISMGYFMDHFSPRKIMFFLALGAGIFTMLLVIRDLNWIRFLFFIQACLALGFMPSMFLGAAKLFEGQQRGQAAGVLLTFAAVFGGGIIPYLMGVSGDLVSFRLGIFLLGAATTVASVLILPLRRLG